MALPRGSFFVSAAHKGDYSDMDASTLSIKKPAASISSTIEQRPQVVDFGGSALHRKSLDGTAVDKNATRLFRTAPVELECVPLCERNLALPELAFRSDGQIEKVVILVFWIEGNGEVVRKTNPSACKTRIQFQAYLEAAIHSVGKFTPLPKANRLAAYTIGGLGCGLVRIRHYFDAFRTEPVPAFGSSRKVRLGLLS